MLQELGADEVIDYRQQSVDQVFKDNPFDAVVDQIGGKSLTSKPASHLDAAAAAAVRIDMASMRTYHNTAPVLFCPRSKMRHLKQLCI